jgi:hypothetical protein
MSMTVDIEFDIHACTIVCFSSSYCSDNVFSVMALVLSLIQWPLLMMFYKIRFARHVCICDREEISIIDSRSQVMLINDVTFAV